jgi:putative flavoprotein involved in K+ transport
MPRRYRGLDAWAWAYLMGTTDRTVSELRSPQECFEPHPHLSGKGGGHTINLHRFARDGVTLLGHLRDVRDGRLTLAADLHESLAAADQAEATFCAGVDRFVTQMGLDAPRDGLPTFMDGYTQAPRTELELTSANIRTVI